MPSPHSVAKYVCEGVKSGILKKPDHCSQCGQQGVRVVAHHDDYDKPYKILWVCDKCHRAKHKNNGGMKLSILQEMARGTYKRNEEIRRLASDGYNFAQIARRYALTRQAVRAIVKKSF